MLELTRDVEPRVQIIIAANGLRYRLRFGFCGKEAVVNVIVAVDTHNQFTIRARNSYLFELALNVLPGAREAITVVDVIVGVGAPNMFAR